MAVYFKDDGRIEKATSIGHLRLRQLLDVNEPKAVRVLARLWNQQKNEIAYSEIRNMIINGFIDHEIVQMWFDEYSEFVADELVPLWQVMTTGALLEFKNRYPAFAWNAAQEGVAEFTKYHAAEFITQCTGQQIAAINALVQRAAIVEDLTVDELAIQIRPLIGLNRPQATANLNYYLNMKKQLKKLNPNMKPETIVKRARRSAIKYAERQHRQRAFSIARSELSFGYNAGEHEGVRQAQAQGLMGETVKEWLTADDNRVCERCRALDGVKVGMEDYFPGTGRQFPPLHPMCLLPGAKVVAGDVIAGSVRRFEGTAITFRTSSGNELTCTPNHPVLTNRGWVAAGKLNKGDKVVECNSIDGFMNTIKAKNYNVPAPIEEIASSFLVSDSVMITGVPVATEDFHGDGTNGDISIIYSNRFLLNNIESKHSERFCYRKFGCRDICRRNVFFNGKSCFDSDFFRCFSSARSFVCGRCKGFAFCFCEFRHSYDVCFGSGSFFNSFVRKDSVDGGALYAESLCDRKDGILVQKRCCNIIPNQRVFSPVGSFFMSDAKGFVRENATGSEPTIYGSYANAERIRNLWDSESSPVHLASVVEISRNEVVDHVYNLQTKSGVYVANNIITHNCRCVVNYYEE
jgi:hypothetical protein